MNRIVRVKRMLAVRKPYLERVKAEKVIVWKKQHKRDCQIRRLEKSVARLESELEEFLR